MIEAVIIRFDAPLISFGDVAIDEYRRTREYPGRSMLAGLFANALGFDHRDTDKIQSLQDRLRHVVRCDRQGVLITDFQTVDLSQPFLEKGWTTWGVLQGRKGGEDAKTGIHIRHREYIANSLYTLAVTLVPPKPHPTVAELAEALKRPARPLFIGRKSCLPAGPLLIDVVEAEDLKAALMKAPGPTFPHHSATQRARIWTDAAGPQDFGALPITDQRDWANQIHVGRRFIKEESVDG